MMMGQHPRRIFELCLFLVALPLLIHARKWTPRSRFWKRIQENKAGLFLYDKSEDAEVDQWDKIQSCLKLKEEANPQNTTLLPHATPRVVKEVFDEEKDEHLLFEIESGFSPHHAASVRHAASCLQELFPDDDFHSHRNFDYGGNDVTFLNHVIRHFLPDVALAIQQTAELAYVQSNWNQLDYFPPGKCGIRTSEYLDYSAFKSLGEHGDHGSLYTVLFSLSNASDYEGGEFFIKDSEENHHFFKPKQYSALVFLSETLHGVTDITSGRREMFTNEYWLHPDPPWPFVRPSLEQMELFEETCETSVPFDEDCKWPSNREVAEWLEDNGREGEVDGISRDADFFNDYYGKLLDVEEAKEDEDGDDEDDEHDEDEDEEDENEEEDIDLLAHEDDLIFTPFRDIATTSVCDEGEGDCCSLSSVHRAFPWICLPGHL